MRVFARTGLNGWQEVIRHDRFGATVDGVVYTFADIWSGTAAPPPPATEGLTLKRWDELLLPLPQAAVTCIAYAMTYPSHRKEMRSSLSFSFPKTSAPILMGHSIPYRPFLDYELEIGVLLHRDNRDRFGFVLVNDLTDRGIQVRRFSRNRELLVKGFTEAKSFEGALLIGPLIAIGTEDAWPGLTSTLRVNDELRQTLAAVDCCETPSGLYETLFAAPDAPEWLLAATGTPDGVLFRAPTIGDKAALLLRHRFSMTKAKDAFLANQRFLAPGDRIEVHSALLGYNHSVVTSRPEIVSPHGEAVTLSDKESV